MAWPAGQHAGCRGEANRCSPFVVYLVALRSLGPTVHHRRSFAPVRLLLEPTLPKVAGEA